MNHIDLKYCPKCNGEITLYSCVSMKANFNCYALCQKCKTVYRMPEAKLKAHGARIYPASIKKAERLWNERAKKEGESEC